MFEIYFFVKININSSVFFASAITLIARETTNDMNPSTIEKQQKWSSIKHKNI